jgi:hypothetical protein
MLLLLVVVVVVRGLVRVRDRLLDMIHVLVDMAGVLGMQGLDRLLDVQHQGVASAPAEILANNDAHQLERSRVRRHGVCRDDPAAFTELVGDRELVEMVAVLGIQPEGNERQA